MMQKSARPVVQPGARYCFRGGASAASALLLFAACFAFALELFVRVEGFDVESLILCLLYTSPSPRDRQKSRMPSSA
jgi:hypothetical protein